MDAPTTLRWSAYEHERTDRTDDWHWALGVLAVCIAVIGVLLHNFLFAILVIIAAYAISTHTRIEHEPATFEISDKGIRVNGRLYRYHSIISFWVEDEDTERPLLLVDTPRPLAPNLIIPIEHIDPQLVRAYLKEHVKEVHMREPLSHKIFEFFGF